MILSITVTSGIKWLEEICIRSRINPAVRSCEGQQQRAEVRGLRLAQSRILLLFNTSRPSIPGIRISDQHRARFWFDRPPVLNTFTPGYFQERSVRLLRDINLYKITRCPTACIAASSSTCDQRFARSCHEWVALMQTKLLDVLSLQIYRHG
jgi:hypothetical protein